MHKSERYLAYLGRTSIQNSPEVGPSPWDSFQESSGPNSAAATEDNHANPWAFELLAKSAHLECQVACWEGKAFISIYDEDIVEVVDILYLQQIFRWYLSRRHWSHIVPENMKQLLKFRISRKQWLPTAQLRCKTELNDVLTFRRTFLLMKDTQDVLP